MPWSLHVLLRGCLFMLMHAQVQQGTRHLSFHADFLPAERVCKLVPIVGVLGHSEVRAPCPCMGNQVSTGHHRQH